MELLKLSLVAAALTSVLFADDMSDLKEEIKALQEKTDALVDETSNIKTGFNTSVEEGKSFSGLGIAASKVYFSESPLSMGGYGEMYFQKQNNGGGTKSSLYRFVPYIGYKFSDKIILNTEIEFEHGGASVDGDGEYVKVEFMYLDFLINEYTNIRLGNFLVPMGLVNQRHEPTLFNSVQRPEVEKYLIPSTWSENGAMVFGNVADEMFAYKFALVSALNTTADGSKWIRGGRGGSWDNENAELAAVARLDYTGTAGLTTGASIYYAKSAKANVVTDSNLLMWDVHLDYHLDALRLYGLYTGTSRSNAQNFAADAVESGNGGYINASYDLFSFTQRSDRFLAFGQIESYQQQAKRADGTTKDHQQNYTLGLNYFPHEQVVLKTDYKITQLPNDDTSYQTASISMGFIF